MIQEYYFTLKNPNNYDVKDYQFKINLKELQNNGSISGLNTEYNNIRFEDLNGNTLPYWVEHDFDQNKTGNVWVKLPIIPQNSYGFIKLIIDDNISNDGNGEDVFLFFDDFNILDKNRWELFNDGGEGTGENIIKIVNNYDTGSVQNGSYLFIKGLSNYRRGIRSKYTVVSEDNIEVLQTFKIENSSIDSDPALILFNSLLKFYLSIDDEYYSYLNQIISYRGNNLFSQRKIKVNYNQRLTWNKYIIRKINNKKFEFEFFKNNNDLIKKINYEHSISLQAQKDLSVEISNHNRGLDCYWDYVYIKKQIDSEIEIESVSTDLPQFEEDKFILYVNNPNNYDLTDYQIKLNLLDLPCENIQNKLLPSYNNIKFYDKDKNPIPHWVEHDISGKNLPIVWVKVPYLKQNSDIKIYFEITGLKTDNGNGEDVFELFDDFETLDTNKWIVHRYSGNQNLEQKVENSILWLVKRSYHKGQNIIQRTFRINFTDKYKIGTNFFVDYVCGTSNDGDGIQIMIDGINQSQSDGCSKGFTNRKQMWVVIFDDGYGSIVQGNGIQIQNRHEGCTIDKNTGILESYRLPNKKNDLSLFKLETHLTGSKIIVNYENRYPTPTVTEFQIQHNIWDSGGEGFFGIGQGSGGSNCSNSSNDSAHGIDYVYIQKYQDQEPYVTKCSKGERYSKIFDSIYRLQKKDDESISTYDLLYNLEPYSDYIIDEIRKYKGLYIFNIGDQKNYNRITFNLSDDEMDEIRMNGTWIKNKFRLIKPSDNVVWYQKLDNGKVLYCKLNYPKSLNIIKYEMGYQNESDLDSIYQSFSGENCINLINEFGSQFIEDTDNDGLFDGWKLILGNQGFDTNNIIKNVSNNEQYISINNPTQDDVFFSLQSELITVSDNTSYFLRFNIDNINGLNMNISFYDDKEDGISNISIPLTQQETIYKFTTPPKTRFMKITINHLLYSGLSKSFTIGNLLLINLKRQGKIPQSLKLQYPYDTFEQMNVNDLNNIIPYFEHSKTLYLDPNQGLVYKKDCIYGEITSQEYIVPIEIDFRIHRYDQFIYLKYYNQSINNFKIHSDDIETPLLFDSLNIMLGIPKYKTGYSHIILEETDFIPIYHDKDDWQFEFDINDQFMIYNQNEITYEEFDDFIESNIHQRLETTQDVYPYKIGDDKSDTKSYISNMFYKNSLINYSWRIPILDKVTKYTYSTLTELNDNIMQLSNKILKESNTRNYTLEERENIENYIWRQLTPFFIRKIQYSDDVYYWTMNVHTLSDFLQRVYDLTDRFGDLFHPYDNDMYIKRTFYNYLNDIGIFKDYVSDIELNTKIYIFLSLEFYKYIYNYFVQRGKRSDVRNILDHQFKHIGQILQMFVVKYNVLSDIEIRSYQTTIEKNKFIDYFNTTGKTEIFQKQKIQLQDKYPERIKQFKRKINLELKQKNVQITDELINKELDKMLETQVYRDLIVVFNKNNLRVQNLQSQLEKFFHFISEHFLPQNMDILFVVVDYDTTYNEFHQIEDYTYIIHEPFEDEYYIDLMGDEKKWI